jgi:hypothetical protein
MIQSAETRLDGHTLVVRIPMRFQHRGGRKRIVAPDGGELAPVRKPRADGTLVKALARAWRWQRMLDDGVYGSVSDIGDTENISKSYVSRILRLALLAPDIVDAILAGSTDQGIRRSWSGRCRRAGRTSGAGFLDDDTDCRKERAQGAALSKVMPSKCKPRSRAWA